MIKRKKEKPPRKTFWGNQKLGGIFLDLLHFFCSEVCPVCTLSDNTMEEGREKDLASLFFSLSLSLLYEFYRQ